MTDILSLLCIFSSVAILVLILIAAFTSKRKKLLVVISIICVIDIMLSVFCFIGKNENTPENSQSESSIENQSPIDISILYDNSIIHSDFHEYSVTVSDDNTQIVFLPNEVLTDISFVSLEYDDSSLVLDEKILTLPAISPEKPLLIGVVFYGDMTTYGISFRDLNGAMRYYSLSLSGFDNSLVVLECNAF